MPEGRINESERKRDLVLIPGDLEVTESLVREAVSSPEALEVLCDRYIPRIYNYVLKRVGRVHDAEDITSIVFEKVISNLTSFDGEKASFSTWIYRITTNCLIDFFRSQGRRKETALEDSPGEWIAQEAGTDNIERCVALIDLLNSISAKYREALALRYFAGMRVLEIAETLGISESAASKRILRGLDELRKKAPGGVLEDLL
ncbi:MAG: RNA polymerase sigma factor [Actinobacteria bacterium]|nr:RNA polymerase sigma factor [Actinomycetota bacterium]